MPRPSVADSTNSTSSESSCLITSGEVIRGFGADLLHCPCFGIRLDASVAQLVRGRAVGCLAHRQFMPETLQRCSQVLAVFVNRSGLTETIRRTQGRLLEVQ